MHVARGTQNKPKHVGYISPPTCKNNLMACRTDWTCGGITDQKLLTSWQLGIMQGIQASDQQHRQKPKTAILPDADKLSVSQHPACKMHTRTITTELHWHKAYSDRIALVWTHISDQLLTSTVTACLGLTHFITNNNLARLRNLFLICRIDK
jgi:hypothetical protein